MTDRYAVIGNPIAHSKSPRIHTEFARQTAQDLSYEALLAPVDGFAAAVEKFRAGGGRGMNVTIPFKLEAFHISTMLTERARLAQAVNTLKFDADTLQGDNTDGAGLVRDIGVNLSFPLAGKRVLLIGAGGAARGVVLPLLAHNPAIVTIVNRTPSKAAALCAQFAAYGRVCATTFEALAGTAHDLVINATSSSLANELPPLPRAVFGVNALAYDLMYAREPTPFLRYAAGEGARIADGLGMLVEQAAESFLLWRGVRPETTSVFDLLRQPAR